MSLELLGLLGILGLVLVLPFSVHHVEEELEAFLLMMGAAAVTLSGQWSRGLAGQALSEPLPLALAVLGAGLAFRTLRQRLRHWVREAQRAWGLRALAFALVVGLGLLSALITAIVAAVVLAEAASVLRLRRSTEVALVVLACFAIGLGSALTPLGGPLAAIAVSRLRGEPVHADFFFLLRLLGPWVAALLAGLGGLAALVGGGRETARPELVEDRPDTWRDLGLRTLKAYLFVAGLVLMGQGFAPLADQWLAPLPVGGLYWANMSSALLDNATLAAAEVGPRLPLGKVQALLLGLILSGGMLIPGNVPNIVCAGKLGITSREWARYGVPLGLALMALVYLVLRNI